jgi:hypothetical protein
MDAIVETIEMKFRMSYVGNMDHAKTYVAILIVLIFVVSNQSLVAPSKALTGPFRLAVVGGNWVEYVVSKSVNAEKICYTFAPGGPGEIISKPLYEGDRIKIVVKRLATGQGTHWFNSTTFYVTEGSAMCDLYLNEQLLWSAESALDDYRPVGLDFHYIVGDGYWDTQRTQNRIVTVGDPNVTMSGSNYGESGEWVRYNSIINKNTGVVLESSCKSYTSYTEDASTVPESEYLIRIVDTNIAGVMPTLSPTSTSTTTSTSSTTQSSTTSKTTSTTQSTSLTSTPGGPDSISGSLPLIVGGAIAVVAVVVVAIVMIGRRKKIPLSSYSQKNVY